VREKREKLTVSRVCVYCLEESEADPCVLWSENANERSIHSMNRQEMNLP